MPDVDRPTSTLSEISHLFLSTLRDKQGVTPKRTPPSSPRPAQLTAAEIAEVAQETQRSTPAPVTAIVAWHLEDPFAAVCAYAQSLSKEYNRIGLIEVDARELRLISFDRGDDLPDPGSGPDSVKPYFEPRHLAEAMEELNSDIDCWLVWTRDPALTEARSALRLISHWVIPSACDSDAIIATYRAIKGLSGIGPARLSLVVVNASTPDQAGHVYEKISSACSQFLKRSINLGPRINTTIQAHPHTIMHWCPTHDPSVDRAGPHWQTIEAFLSRSGPAIPREPATVPPEMSEMADESCVNGRSNNRDATHPGLSPNRDGLHPGCRGAEDLHESLRLTPSSIATSSPAQSMANQLDEPVIALADSSPDSVLNAVFDRQSAGLVACPVPVPMCEHARLGVCRDRRLVLVAVAGRGLKNLGAIGYAYRWLIENRQLVAMALPQLAIDCENLPRLRLLVEQADRDAEMLRPILQNQLVEIHPFRRLNWSGRLGLLLEAA